MADRRDELFYNQKNLGDTLPAEERAAADAYCARYMAFLDRARTERESVTEAVRLAEAAGFREFRPGMKTAPGEKLYRSVRGKALMLAVTGKKPMACGAHIEAAHVDSPRLDVKPVPLYEDGELAYLKTHYYGGLRKYQWVALPLEVHGVVVLRGGTEKTVSLGTDAGDPAFVITDLLPHLAGEQKKKPLSEAIPGESLNLVMGSLPAAGDGGKDRVKLAVLELLNKKYGMTEEDFLSAELEVVPALPVREIGLDRSLIGAYGHDDRVCAYAELEAILGTEAPELAAVCILADKEEIGSEGVSGMQSAAFDTFMEDLCAADGSELRRCYENSLCISADVTVAFDPDFPEVCDKRNSARLNYGIGIAKFTGVGGKGGSNDASAEVVGRIRRIFAQGGVVWQMSELGKVDAGGGGTVAKFMAKRDIDTIDAGVPVLSMHSPYELVSKLDCYMTEKGMKAVYAEK